MQNALIISPYGLNNYGNRLQNYAMSELLRWRGFTCDTLNYLPLFSGGMKTYKEFAKHIVWNPLNPSVRARRQRAFVEFDKHIEKRTVYLRGSLRKLGQQYSLFCIGSDQIWNPHHIWDPYLQFANFADSGKKIAYAPSFGISELPPSFIEPFRAGLDKIDCLSVREKTGQELIKALVDREVPVVLDPTLLLGREGWDEVASSRMVPKGRYAFSYFLGPNCAEQRRRVEDFCRIRGYENVELMNLENGTYYSAGPQDFVGLLRDSSMVFTNSFHAMAFSLMYGRPVGIFERDSGSRSMNSRILDFVHEFGMEGCLVESEIDESKLAFDYKSASKTLEEKSAESKGYLDCALGM